MIVTVKIGYRKTKKRRILAAGITRSQRNLERSHGAPAARIPQGNASPHHDRRRRDDHVLQRKIFGPRNPSVTLL